MEKVKYTDGDIVVVDSLDAFEQAEHADEGMILSICHVIYIILAYPNSSIIYYISKELWL